MTLEGSSNQVNEHLTQSPSLLEEEGEVVVGNREVLGLCLEKYFFHIRIFFELEMYLGVAGHRRTHLALEDSWWAVCEHLYGVESDLTTIYHMNGGHFWLLMIQNWKIGWHFCF